MQLSDFQPVAGWEMRLGYFLLGLIIGHLISQVVRRAVERHDP